MKVFLILLTMQCFNAYGQRTALWTDLCLPDLVVAEEQTPQSCARRRARIMNGKFSPPRDGIVLNESGIPFSGIWCAVSMDGTNGDDPPWDGKP